LKPIPKGDLRVIVVYGFVISKIEFLLSYRMADEDIDLIAIGPHENYYRDLKSYIKKR